MSERELRKLNRQELLEMLLAQSKKVEELEDELTQAQAALEERDIVLSEAGSIAEASLRLNGVFEAAQRASQQYIDSVRTMSERQKAACAKMEAESQARAKEIVEEAKKNRADIEAAANATAQGLLQKAREESQRYWEEVSVKLEALYQQYTGLRELMTLDLPTKKQDEDR